MDDPTPLEDTDPWLADQIRQIVNGKHEVIKSLYASDKDVFIVPKQMQAPRKIGRNDPCPCMSGRKYKHCCGR